MEEACGFGLAKRTSTLGSPTSDVKNDISVPAGSLERRYVVPLTMHNFSCLHFGHDQLVSCYRLDFDFSLDFFSVNKGDLSDGGQSIRLTYHMDLSVHIPLPQHFGPVEEFIKPGQEEKFFILGSVLGPDSPLSGLSYTFV